MTHQSLTPALLLAPVDAVAYLRVSTESQAREERSSLEDQRAAVEALALRLGVTLELAAIFADPGVSGQNAEDRPAFMALVSYCQSHPRPARAPGFVLALNDSRFGRFRNPDEAAYWRVVLARAGWHVRFSENDDTSDLVGRSVLRAIGGAQASAYSHAVRANAKRGARATALRGLWQNESPFGYRRLATRAGRDPVTLPIGVRKADDQQVRLTPGPEEEQELVRWCFTAYASGEHSLGSLSRALMTRWPSRKWSRRVVQALLENPAYVGDVVWCRRPHDKLERRETPLRPREEWAIKHDAHPALVSRELFQAVRGRMALNKRERRSTSGGYALSGLVHCADCGKPYVGGGGPKGPEGDVDRYRFYRCSGSDGPRPVCARPIGTLQKRFVEPRVIAEIAKAVAHPRVQALIAEEIDRVLEATGDVHADRRRALERNMKELAAQRETLISAVARGVVADDDAVAALARLRSELEQNASELERLRFAGRTVERLTTERNRLLDLAKDFAARAKSMSGYALRELLRPWLESAVVDKGRRTLTLTIRRIPNAGPFLLATMPARDEQHQKDARVVRRTIHLPPSRVTRRSAHG